MRASLDIPVFHDDQHGTAVVTLAAFLNALRVVGKRIEDVKVVVTGVGAAGVAVTRTLQAAGVRNVVGCDSQGAVYRGRPGLPDVKARYAEETNPENDPGQRRRGARRAPTSTSGSRSPGAVTAAGIAQMATDAIVFAMANPTPEILPEEIAGLAAVIATGRSDYPNQINNVLAFPGSSAARSTFARRRSPSGWRSRPGMRSPPRSAPEELAADYIVPSVFNRDVVPAVAAAVAQAAERGRRRAPPAAKPARHARISA